MKEQMAKLLQQFTKPDCSYYLQYWGSVCNDGFNEELFGLINTRFWFPSIELRETARGYLEAVVERERNSGNLVIICFRDAEGDVAKTKLNASMTFVYKDAEYEYIYNGDYGVEESTIRYMFDEGNYSCDCNKSLFISRTVEDFPEMDCGNEIAIKDFVIFESENFDTEAE